MVHTAAPAAFNTWDAQDRLLWRDKTCPARTKLLMSWKAFLYSQHHMFHMACRTAKVTVGKQKKYSNMVKGRNHDQAFDETLEFVLAAGGLIGCSTMHVLTAYLAQPSVQPLLMLHCHACIHCSLYFRNVCFRSEMSILLWEPKIRTPGYSNTLFFIGNIFCAAQPCVHALFTLHSASGLVMGSSS